MKNFVRFLVAVQLLPALESGEETLVGGQAVLEGVMMRSPHAWAIACRKPSGEVVTMREPLDRPSEKHKWMAWPIVRGDKSHAGLPAPIPWFRLMLVS